MADSTPENEVPDGRPTGDPQPLPGPPPRPRPCPPPGPTPRGRVPGPRTPAAAHRTPDPAAPSPVRPARATAFPVWGTAGAGVVTVALGVLLLVWTSATLTVVTWLLAANLAVSGVLGLVWAFGSWPRAAGERALLAVTGVVALVMAVLVAARPEQTLRVVVLLVGVSWLLDGAVRIARALRPGAADRRANLVLGTMGILAGGYLLCAPEVSVVALTRLAGAFMVLSGLIWIGSALALRRGAR